MLSSIFGWALLVQLAMAALGGAMLYAGQTGKKRERGTFAFVAWAAGILLFILPVGFASGFPQLLVSLPAMKAHPDLGTPGFLLGILLVLLPQVLAHGAVAWLAFHWRIPVPFLLGHNLLEIRRRKRRVEAAAAAAQGVLLVSWLIMLILAALLQPRLAVLAPVAAVLLGLSAAAWTGRHHAHELDESARYLPGEAYAEHLDRVTRLAEGFGWTIREVHVFRIINRSPDSPGRAGDDKQLELGLDRWRDHFIPARPTIPEELLATTTPDVFAAGLAMRYAHAALLNPLRWKAIGGFTPWTIGLIACGGLLFLAAEFVILLLAMELQAFEALAVGLLATAGVTVFAGTAAVVLRHRQFHTTAYQAWTAQVPGASAAAFATALQAYDQAMRPGTPGRSIEEMASADHRLRSFLRRTPA